MNLHSYQWTSPRSHWRTMHPRPWLPTEPQHHLPLPILLWNIHLKWDSHISMTAEVRDLLLHAILDTSSQPVRGLYAKRPTSAALEARMEDSSKLVVTSPQASPWAALPDDTLPIGHLSPMTPVPEVPRVGQHPCCTAL